MNRNYEPHKKSSRVVAIVIVTIAVSGYFMGLRQTSSSLGPAQPVSAITQDSLRRAAEETNAVPGAVAYRDVNWLAHGQNANWTNHLSKLVQPPLASKTENASEVDREAALNARAGRRAYNGAPPVVPHPIPQDSSASCLACHGEGLVVKDRIASKISHPHYANCTQCHVPSTGTRIPIAEPELKEPLTANLFVGAKEPQQGSRAWPKAPPTIPHSTAMRSDCMSCHGSTGLYALRTPHPERQSCQQCHVPNAGRDQYQFLVQKP